MQFGLMFFSSGGDGPDPDRYATLREAARFADAHGFACIWTPERHFHPFGGLFPNPALTTCALATITERISLRAGSLISPIHDVIRIAEEWSVADNLSGGRVAVSFGSGWNARDFVLFPDRYARRHKIMYEQIETIQQLWSGDAILRTDSFGHEVEVRMYPRPIQPRLPVWITSSGSDDTFVRAGSIGANLLTHLLGQDIGTLDKRLASWRQALENHGFDPRAGTASLMLHTCIGRDADAVRRIVRNPLREYLRSAVNLERHAAMAGGDISGGGILTDAHASERDDELLLDLACARYCETAALIGTPATCREMVTRLEEIGVDEIACLIDFGLTREQVFATLKELASLASFREGAPAPMDAFVHSLEV